MVQVKIEICSPNLAQNICRELTENLPDWFGIPEANERYATGCLNRTSMIATIDNIPVGMVVLEFPFKNNANIFWMAVKKKHHGQGIGSQLLVETTKYCKEKKIPTITVETLSPKVNDENYLRTFQFYEKNGFNPLFELEPYGPELIMCYMIKLL